ncbi:MAG: retron St85 family RNA-directed DNA polymerase [Ignavibacteria bacterium]|nr:retron St85 family RNA-directed DNA polymerase [Ignavibacteria bacterium]
MKRKNNFKLNLFGIPIINTLDDLSLLTHITKSTLFRLSKKSYLYYKEYTVPKKNKGVRKISQPSAKLKGIQSWILQNILEKLKVSPSCKGFEKGTSTADNTKPHVGANAILVVDIKDFYPSIKGNFVFSLFKLIGYNNLISTILTNLCVLNDSLPQGSPCSPKIANLVAWKLDIRIQSYVGKRGIIYTRYADDLTFSSINPANLIKILPIVKDIIESENFEINKNKTRFIGISRCRKITGLVLSDNNFGVGKRKYKNIRSKVFKLKDIEKIEDDKEKRKIKEMKEVYGLIAYLKSVDKERYLRILDYIRTLSVKYPNSILTNISFNTKTTIAK